MRKSGVLTFVVAALGCVWAGAAGSAEAQARESVAMSSAPALRPASSNPVKDDRTEQDRDQTPMGAAGIGIKIGVAGMGAGQYTLRDRDGQTYTGKLGKRHGLHLALPITLGSGVFGWTFEPFFDRSSMEYELRDLYGDVTDTEETSLTAYGMYLGPVFNIHVIPPLYLGTGFGLKAAYVKSDDFDVAADAYGRIPVNATYYFTNQLAVVAEMGFGYGVSALVDTKLDVNIDTAARTAEKTGNEPAFGKAFAWDFSVGVRLP